MQLHVIQTEKPYILKTHPIFNIECVYFYIKFPVIVLTDTLMSATTSLDSLPVSPQTSGSYSGQSPAQGMAPPQNIKLELNENKVMPNQAEALAKKRASDLKNNSISVPSLPTQEQTNKLITGIQQAAGQGALQLPAADIPMDPSHITSDPAAQPNYVPPVPDNSVRDYIAEVAASKDSDNAVSSKTEMNHSDSDIDTWEKEIQAPIIVAALYLAFQQPVVQKKFLHITKGLLGADGNPTMAGHISGAIVFAALYLGVTKFVKQLSI